MAHPIIDVNLTANVPQDLMFEKHIAFLKALEKKEDPMLDYMKLSAVYWSLTALDLMKNLDAFDKANVLKFVKSCQNADGGFAPASGHDSHILSTLSGIQILAMYDEFPSFNRDGAIKYISGLQNPDGSFNGDKWGEVDSRFSFCALAALSLLGVIPTGVRDFTQPIEGVDIRMAVEYLARCQNPDGGFGTRPGSESHAGQAYCVIGALSLLGQLRQLDIGKAAWWLAERQLPSGGLNGRPGKEPDVCYSWYSTLLVRLHEHIHRGKICFYCGRWVLASLTILGCLMWIDAADLAKFICASQDSETGGISDRPGNTPDPFHTLFGLAGLSLLSRLNANKASEATENGDEGTRDPLSVASYALREINPVFCMPQHIIDRLSIRVQIL